MCLKPVACPFGAYLTWFGVGGALVEWDNLAWEETEEPALLDGVLAGVHVGDYVKYVEG